MDTMYLQGSYQYIDYFLWICSVYCAFCPIYLAVTGFI